jgi:hypothetical protein
MKRDGPGSEGSSAGQAEDEFLRNSWRREDRDQKIDGWKVRKLKDRAKTKVYRQLEGNMYLNGEIAV